MSSFDAEAVHLKAVEIFQATFEQPYAVRQATLPAGLHPTTPPLLVILAWQVAESPWGPFAMAQARVECRSGVRPRGFVAGGIVDNADMAAALASGFGLPGQPGAVRLARRYDSAELVVESGGRTIAHVVGLDPDPLSQGDVQFSVTTTLASTPRGLRLVQVEPEYELRRVERLRPRAVAFDGAAWGEPLLQPRNPVSATIAVGDVTIPGLRYLSRPDVSAFEGTERL
jgi:hypothetical protein